MAFPDASSADASSARDSFTDDPFAYDPAAALVAVPAPGPGPGNWSGAAAALVDGDRIVLTWRERRPLEAGRGVGTVVAVSSDGVSFERVATLGRDLFGAESLERPALVRLPDGRWRLYLSCATPGSKHWWIESVTADSLGDLPSGERVVALPGNGTVGVKDPVVWQDPSDAAEPWRMAVCCHPLDVPGAEDRMTTRLAVSADGLVWRDAGEILHGTPGAFDERGARLTAVLPGALRPGGLPEYATYDGRPDAASNWYETTALARWDGSRYVTVPGAHWRSPSSDGALRYATVVAQGDRLRWYAEAARPDGAHDLITWTSPAPASGA